MKSELNQVAEKINAELRAAGISWANAKPWMKEVEPGRIISRIYLSVGRATSGYIAVAEDGTLSIPRSGNGSNIDRPALANAVEAIVRSL